MDSACGDQGCARGVPQVLAAQYSTVPVASEGVPAVCLPQVLAGHTENAEFALAACRSAPLVLSGGQDKRVLLWSVQDHIAGSLQVSFPRCCSPLALAPAVSTLVHQRYTMGAIVTARGTEAPLSPCLRLACPGHIGTHTIEDTVDTP